MNNKLSIIIPCFNCSSTLAEAVDSIYIQNLIIPFEVLMIDDCSNDETRTLIIELSNKYPHIKYFFKKNNSGAGSTRNFGISKSGGNLIYCLDSDNFFAPNSLQMMINLMQEKNCDGVAFSHRRFFIDCHKDKYNQIDYEKYDRPVTINDMFACDRPILDNFLFSKESFKDVGGFPEHHGFDTQSFEIRFLSAGKKVYFCPNAIFYHRQGSKNKSYFEREYESGYFSKNMYLIYEDIIFLFSPMVRNKIINFDIFKTNLLEDSLEHMLINLYNQDNKNFFIENYNDYIITNNFERFVNNHINSEEITDIFCLFVYFYKKGDIFLANKYFRIYMEKCKETKVSRFNLLRIMTLMFYNFPFIDNEIKVSEIINDIQLYKRNIYINSNLFQRIVRKIFKKFIIINE